MPSANEILSDLGRIANGGFAYAVALHVLLPLLTASVLLWADARQARTIAQAVVSGLMASVSAFAFGYGNVFNGVVFALVTCALTVLAFRQSASHEGGTRWTRAVGASLGAFAWFYPHFLAGHSPWEYAYGAPLGLLPCPSLSLSIGLALLGWVPRIPAWSLLLAGTGLFYGLFGALRLGVHMDLVLFAGALALLVHELRQMHGARLRRASARSTLYGA